MIRRLLNRSLDGLFVAGLARSWARRLHGRTLCLVYHRVSDAPAGFLEWGGVPTMSRRELRRDLECLQGLGGRFLTLEELRAGRQPFPDAPNFVITFDDGFRDTYDNGLSVLDELGIKGVVFQVAELIDGAELNWEHALYRYAFESETREQFGAILNDLLASAHAQRPPPGNDMRAVVEAARDSVPTGRIMQVIESFRAQADDGEARAELARDLYPRASTVRAAREAGHEIGSHGLRHVARRFLDREAFRRDASDAGSLIDSAAGKAPGAYAYPFGCHESGDEEILADMYGQAAIAEPGRLDPAQPFTLRRCPWPGAARNALRRRRWLLTGQL